MSRSFDERLNQILPRITSPELLSSEGIGNEIACYIFDYPAGEELRVREHIKATLSQIQRSQKDLRVLHLNLLDVVVAYLDQRGLLDKALAMQQSKGDSGVLRALKGPLAAEKLGKFIAEEYQPTEYDLFLLSGVGSVWPVLRAHSLLNCLHPVIGRTPLVMFYPGTFDGTAVKLFGRISSESAGPGKRPYYRAFSLVPGGKES